MNKDAYYFPHFSNARNDRKIRRLRKALGIEGYGIYFMLLELLRDQEGYKYPLSDVDLIADEFGTSQEKIKTVISAYDLFTFDPEDNFFSVKFIEFLEPYNNSKERKRISGVKGNLIKYGKCTKEELKDFTDDEILLLNQRLKENSRSAITTGSLSDHKESKVKESKVNNILAKIAEKESPKPKTVYAEEYVSFSKRFYNALMNHRVISTKKNPESKSWLEPIRLMVEKDGVKLEMMIEAMGYYFQNLDNHYLPLIQSPKSLREKWDSLRAHKNRNKN